MRRRSRRVSSGAARVPRPPAARGRARAGPAGRRAAASCPRAPPRARHRQIRRPQVRVPGMRDGTGRDGMEWDGMDRLGPRQGRQREQGAGGVARPSRMRSLGMPAPCDPGLLHAWPGGFRLPPAPRLISWVFLGFGFIFYYYLFVFRFCPDFCCPCKKRPPCARIRDTGSV